MENCFIKLKDVHLSYPSTLFNSRTLKQAIFQLIRLEKTKKRLDDIHALRGISLEVHNGEKVGVIGSNGAGKSTLLKAIAGIYSIQHGEINVEGKLRSLFDLSLGFEMDATGRENIMYRGLLLGEEPYIVKQKTDEIIDFAELGDFIDYPIKSYSAGMIVRLAFAISTMISGDILLLDEVFSVGDARFVEKARRRITGLMESAKIMIFVAHDHKAIRDMCNRAVWINNGVVEADGSPDDIIKMYLDSTINIKNY